MLHPKTDPASTHLLRRPSGSGRRRSFPRFVATVAAAGMLFAVCPAGAKPPSPKAKPSEARPAATPAGSASVRFWKTDLREHAALRVVLTPNGGKPADGRAIGGGGAGYLFTNYVGVPTGPGSLDLLEGSDSHPLASVAVNPGPGSYFTVLVTEPLKPGDPPRLEVVEDRDGSAGPAESVPTQIIVRNLLPDIKDARVSVGDVLSVQFVSGTSYLMMNGIAPATYQVHTVGTTPDGKPFEWTLEADFKLHRRQTLLIYPDSYGRIRPRLSVDGESVPEPPAEPGEQS